jgi:hypothetical protein
MKLYEGDGRDGGWEQVKAGRNVEEKRTCDIMKPLLQE